MQITDHKHKAPFDAIVVALIKHSNDGLKMHIGKVRAHIGVYGNEMADQGAKQACNGDAMHDAHVLAGTNPYRAILANIHGPTERCPQRARNNGICAKFAHQPQEERPQCMQTRLPQGIIVLPSILVGSQQSGTPIP